MSDASVTKGSAAQNAGDHDRFDVKAVNSKENRAFYATREKIHPKRAEGKFRRLKWWIMAVTLGVYYITPWLRWDRGPHAPDQAVLIDMANRRFYFFFIEIWPQEFFFVAGLLVMAGIGLFLVTSTVGRAWCGYTCPQTVWVDLFLVVERAIEGDRNARIRLDKAPMNSDKLIKRISKHAIWLLIALATGGAWIFYFADAPTLFYNFFTGQAPFVAYSTVAVLAAFTYVFGGLMREQVCTYMCPWPRVQAAMLDENSLTITYNNWRGEPRSLHRKKQIREGNPVGDCVDCNACVAVCPMGIDIRDGQQLECITCALCIDACDGVMSKLGLEKGLISYATLGEYNQNMQAAGAQTHGDGAVEVFDKSTVKPLLIRTADGTLDHSKIVHTSLGSFIRPRTLLYIFVYALIGLGLLAALLLRDRLDVNVIRDRNPLFVTLSDGSIRNGYELKILNMRNEPRRFRVTVEDLPGASVLLSGQGDYEGDSFNVEVDPDRLRSIQLYVKVPRDDLASDTTDFTFLVEQLGGDDPETETADARFEAPKGTGR